MGWETYSGDMAERIAVAAHPNAPAAFGNLLGNVIVAALAVWFFEAIGALSGSAALLFAVGAVLVVGLSWMELAFWRSLVIGETPRSRTNPQYVTLALILSVMVLGALLTFFTVVWVIHQIF
jgi:hypothetical protein